MERISTQTALSSPIQWSQKQTEHKNKESNKTGWNVHNRSQRLQSNTLNKWYPNHLLKTGSDSKLLDRGSKISFTIF